MNKRLISDSLDRDRFFILFPRESIATLLPFSPPYLEKSVNFSAPRGALNIDNPTVMSGH